MTTKVIPFDEKEPLNTDALMEQLGVDKAEANKMLWDLFDQQFSGSKPVQTKELTLTT